MIASDSSDIKIIKDADGDDLGTWEQGDRFFLGVLSCDIAIPLDARAAALLISELFAWFARTSPQSEKSVPPERPVAEMTREEIRAELGELLKTDGIDVVQRITMLDDIERGAYLSARTVRHRDLSQRLHELAQKAGPA